MLDADGQRGTEACSPAALASADIYVYGNQAVQSIAIDRTITAIGSLTVVACPSLVTIDAPSLTAVGNLTIRHCESLEGVSLPAVASSKAWSFV